MEIYQEQRLCLCVCFSITVFVGPVFVDCQSLYGSDATRVITEVSFIVTVFIQVIVCHSLTKILAIVCA